ncbi:MAG: ABC transporter permease subunit [Treponema sp.]|jgi:putative aldouronate transport system permease protein|nr:ABC transporter permease subunit [Treponema sp.]
MAAVKVGGKISLIKIKRSGGLYLLLFPAIALSFCFAYLPMYGVIIAFKDYRNALGVMGSPFSEPLYKHFERFFNSFQFRQIITNTLAISFYHMLATVPLPIIMALILNQMKSKIFKRTFQTISYMPHFISTVVMVGIILIMLSPSSGLIGHLFRLFGSQAPNLMGVSKAFSSVYVWSDVWQHTGWDSIIYLAALSAVDPALYEAAIVDGANRWQRMWRIDFPMLLPTACILLILRAGSIMSVGFEKVYLMQNSLNLVASEVISTYVYKVGIINAQYSYSSAIGLFNTLVNLVLLLTVNFISKKLSDTALW